MTPSDTESIKRPSLLDKSLICSLSFSSKESKFAAIISLSWEDTEVSFRRLSKEGRGRGRTVGELVPNLPGSQKLYHGSLLWIEEPQILATELHCVHEPGQLTHGQDNRPLTDPEMLYNLGHLLNILKKN